jgi:hypothetical protein
LIFPRAFNVLLKINKLLMKYRNLLFFTMCIVHSAIVFAQQNNSDTTGQSHEKTKKGWNFGVLPAIAYDSDLGLLYGVVGSIFHYGDGTLYPKYRHSFYFEWSRTTKGGGKNIFTYDSEYLIPKIRVTIEASRLTEQALSFYGFNGSNAPYIHNFEENNDSSYISRMFYRHERKLTRIRLDFQGNVIGRKLRWLAGFTYFNSKIGTVNIHKLNKGKKGDDVLPDTLLLYNKFVEWGIIPDNQKNGGITNLIKVGLIYDTRDNEPNPMRGIWTEALLLGGPSFLGNKQAYAKIAVTHRQYFTLKKEVLNLAYRLSYQGKIAGEMPFYMLPYVFNSNQIRDGLGGARTLRGILRNRIVGEDFLYGNLELRWKFLRMYKFKQNFYFALNGFTDFGRVVRKYKYTTSNIEALNYLSKGKPEKWHQSYGAGFYAVMNQNFVAEVNYGIAANSNDGNTGLYIGLDFLF